MKDIIQKVNYYSKKSKLEKLNDEEILEQKKYRKLYLEKFKSQFKQKLDSVKIVNKEDLN